MGCLWPSGTSGVFGGFLKTFLPLAAVQTTIGLTQFIGSFFLTRTGQSDVIAAMALSDTFYSLLLSPVRGPLIEISGVYLSREFGAANYPRLGHIYQQTFLILICIFILFYLTAAFSRELLVLIGTSDKLARDSAELIVLSLIPSTFEGFNNNTFAFLVSQGVTGPFRFYPFFLMVQSFFVGRYLITTLDMKANGLVLARLIQELINMVVYHTIKWCYCHPDTYSWQPIMSSLEGLGRFIKKAAFSMAVVYGDYLAYYFNMFILVQYDDKNDISAWSTVASLASVFYYLSLGFANTNRTDIGALLGQGEPSKAKSRARVYSAYNAMFAVVAGGLLVVFSWDLARFFTDNQELVVRIAPGIRIYGLFVVGYMQVYPMFTLFRLTNLDSFLMWSSGVANPLFIMSITSVMVLVWDWHLFGIYVGYGLCQAIIVMVFAAKLFWAHDWSKAALSRPVEESMLTE